MQKAMLSRTTTPNIASPRRSRRFHPKEEAFSLSLVPPLDCAPSVAINATLYEKLNFNFMRDMLPVAGIAQAPAVFAINSSVPAKTVTGFIAYAKANPGRINMGSAGIGSTGHLAGELLKMMAGVDLVHVPYRGNAPALTDLIAGQVEIVFPSAASSIEYIRTGKLRGLAVTGATRSNA